MQFLIFTS